MMMPPRLPSLAERIAVTLPPSDEPVVMYQRWADLLFLHWPVPAELLQPLVPPGLTIDTFDGQAYVGLVPFTITGARPVGLPPLPWLSYFPETNVRTYVHVDGRGPGVWFFSLDAASPIPVRLARALYKLPYCDARMSSACREDGAIDYACLRTGLCPLPARLALRYGPTNTPPAPARPGTLEHFLLERYILYSYDGRLHRAQVYHESYPAQTAWADISEESMVAAAGIDLPWEERKRPPLMHYAKEVVVRVFPLRSVPAANTADDATEDAPAKG